MKTITEQGKGHTGNATTMMQEASSIIHRYGQLFIKVSTQLSELAKPIHELSKEKVPFN